MFVFVISATAGAQTPNAWGYNTGYGAVYGSFGLAQTMQSMYNVARARASQRTASNSRVNRSGGPETAPPGTASPSTTPRNYGRFRPDATVDTGASLAEALGETPDEKALIRRIYATTKAAYEKEAQAKGWANNVAGGLTFFTVTAAAVYSGGEEPVDETMTGYFDVVNAALDETPGFASVPNKHKQGFNDMLVGFTGILLAAYLEAKQNNDAIALANSKKLAGMLIEIVLRTSPENIRIENRRVVMK